MNIAVIPARGGSKRIPRKNIKLFCGKPMIAWSIEAAKASGCFDRIIVSTDDEEIARVAREWGAEVPFLRPPELSDDWSGTTPVVLHAIDWLSSQGVQSDYVCCLYATAPLLQPAFLEQGVKVLQGHPGKQFALSVTSFAFPVQRALRLTGKGYGVEPLYPECMGKRSQDLEDVYHDAGQFYWGKWEAWRERKGMFKQHSIPVILPRYLVQDIDTEEDWITAEQHSKTIRGLQ